MAQVAATGSSAVADILRAPAAVGERAAGVSG
jgi:hypothetical protein